MPHSKLVELIKIFFDINDFVSKKNLFSLMVYRLVFQCSVWPINTYRGDDCSILGRRISLNFSFQMESELFSKEVHFMSFWTNSRHKASFSVTKYVLIFFSKCCWLRVPNCDTTRITRGKRAPARANICNIVWLGRFG
jgi:hypothetical protein